MLPVRADQLEPGDVVRHLGRPRLVTRRVWTPDNLIFIGFQDGRWLECAADELLPRVPTPAALPAPSVAGQLTGGRRGGLGPA
jgi:hypothetical protein